MQPGFIVYLVKTPACQVGVPSSRLGGTVLCLVLIFAYWKRLSREAAVTP